MTVSFCVLTGLVRILTVLVHRNLYKRGNQGLIKDGELRSGPLQNTGPSTPRNAPDDNNPLLGLTIVIHLGFSLSVNNNCPRSSNFSFSRLIIKISPLLLTIAPGDCFRIWRLLLRRYDDSVAFVTKSSAPNDYPSRLLLLRSGNCS